MPEHSSEVVAAGSSLSVRLVAGMEQCGDYASKGSCTDDSDRSSQVYDIPGDTKEPTASRKCLKEVKDVVGKLSPVGRVPESRFLDRDADRAMLAKIVGRIVGKGEDIGLTSAVESIDASAVTLECGSIATTRRDAGRKPDVGPAFLSLQHVQVRELAESTEGSTVKIAKSDPVHPVAASGLSSQEMASSIAGSGMVEGATVVCGMEGAAQSSGDGKESDKVDRKGGISLSWSSGSNGVEDGTNVCQPIDEEHLSIVTPSEQTTVCPVGEQPDELVAEVGSLSAVVGSKVSSNSEQVSDADCQVPAKHDVMQISIEGEPTATTGELEVQVKASRKCTTIRSNEAETVAAIAQNSLADARPVDREEQGQATCAVLLDNSMIPGAGGAGQRTGEILEVERNSSTIVETKDCRQTIPSAMDTGKDISDVGLDSKPRVLNRTGSVSVLTTGRYQVGCRGEVIEAVDGGTVPLALNLGATGVENSGDSRCGLATTDLCQEELSQENGAKECGVSGDFVCREVQADCAKVVPDIDKSSIMEPVQKERSHFNGLNVPKDSVNFLCSEGRVDSTGNVQDMDKSLAKSVLKGDILSKESNGSLKNVDPEDANAERECGLTMGKSSSGDRIQALETMLEGVEGIASSSCSMESGITREVGDELKFKSVAEEIFGGQEMRSTMLKEVSPFSQIADLNSTSVDKREKKDERVIPLEKHSIIECSGTVNSVDNIMSTTVNLPNSSVSVSVNVGANIHIREAEKVEKAIVEDSMRCDSCNSTEGEALVPVQTPQLLPFSADQTGREVCAQFSHSMSSSSKLVGVEEASLVASPRALMVKTTHAPMKVIPLEGNAELGMKSRGCDTPTKDEEGDTMEECGVLGSGSSVLGSEGIRAVPKQDNVVSVNGSQGFIEGRLEEPVSQEMECSDNGGALIDQGSEGNLAVSRHESVVPASVSQALGEQRLKRTASLMMESPPDDVQALANHKIEVMGEEVGVRVGETRHLVGQMVEGSCGPESNAPLGLSHVPSQDEVQADPMHHSQACSGGLQRNEDDLELPPREGSQAVLGGILIPRNQVDTVSVLEVNGFPGIMQAPTGREVEVACIQDNKARLIETQTLTGKDPAVISGHSNGLLESNLNDTAKQSDTVSLHSERLNSRVRVAADDQTEEVLPSEVVKKDTPAKVQSIQTFLAIKAAERRAAKFVPRRAPGKRKILAVGTSGRNRTEVVSKELVPTPTARLGCVLTQVHAVEDKEAVGVGIVPPVEVLADICVVEAGPKGAEVEKAIVLRNPEAHFTGGTRRDVVNGGFTKDSVLRCFCGRFAALKVVGYKSPNRGLRYWSCETFKPTFFTKKRHRKQSDNDKPSCRFFQWLDAPRVTMEDKKQNRMRKRRQLEQILSAKAITTNYSTRSATKQELLDHDASKNQTLLLEGVPTVSTPSSAQLKQEDSEDQEPSKKKQKTSKLEPSLLTADSIAFSTRASTRKRKGRLITDENDNSTPASSFCADESSHEVCVGNCDNGLPRKHTKRVKSEPYRVEPPGHTYTRRGESSRPLKQSGCMYRAKDIQRMERATADTHHVRKLLPVALAYEKSVEVSLESSEARASADEDEDSDGQNNSVDELSPLEEPLSPSFSFIQKKNVFAKPRSQRSFSGERPSQRNSISKSTGKVEKQPKISKRSVKKVPQDVVGWESSMSRQIQKRTKEAEWIEVPLTSPLVDTEGGQPRETGQRVSPNGSSAIKHSSEGLAPIFQKAVKRRRTKYGDTALAARAASNNADASLNLGRGKKVSMSETKPPELEGESLKTFPKKKVVENHCRKSRPIESRGPSGSKGTRSLKACMKESSDCTATRGDESETPHCECKTVRRFAVLKTVGPKTQNRGLRYWVCVNHRPPFQKKSQIQGSTIEESCKFFRWLDTPIVGRSERKRQLATRRRRTERRRN